MAEAHALSEMERRILDFMVQYLRANTYQPSIREIGERFGIKSTKTVSEHLQALADHNIEVFQLRGEHDDARDTEGADSVRRGGLRWA